MIDACLSRTGQAWASAPISRQRTRVWSSFLFLLFFPLIVEKRGGVRGGGVLFWPPENNRLANWQTLVLGHTFGELNSHRQCARQEKEIRRGIEPMGDSNPAPQSLSLRIEHFQSALAATPRTWGRFSCVLYTKLELELIQSHMAQKPVLRGEVGCACVAREVSAERGDMGERGCARRFGGWVYTNPNQAYIPLGSCVRSRRGKCCRKR